MCVLPLSFSNLTQYDILHGPLPFSQDSANRPYPEKAESSQYHHTLFIQHLPPTLPSMPRSIKWSLHAPHVYAIPHVSNTALRRRVECHNVSKDHKMS